MNKLLKKQGICQVLCLASVFKVSLDALQLLRLVVCIGRHKFFRGLGRVSNKINHKVLFTDLLVKLPIWKIDCRRFSNNLKSSLKPN